MERQRESEEVAALRRAVCSMVAHHDYHRFPATGPKYTAQMLHMWLRHFPGLSMEAAQHGAGRPSLAQLHEKTKHKKLMDRALAINAIRAEESVVQLRAEFDIQMPPKAQVQKLNVADHVVECDTESGVQTLLAPHAGGANNGCGGCLRECLRAFM